MRKTIAIQAIGYPLLLAAVYAWLGIADRSIWQVALSALLSLAIITGAAWLIAAATGVTLRKAPWLIAAAAAALAALRWPAAILALLMIVPMASGATPALRKWRYWAAAAGLTAVGVLLPWLLLRWVPKFDSFGAQTASMVVRFSLAYGVALAAWLTMASLPRRFSDGR